MILKRSSRLSSVSLAPYRAPFVPPYKPREVWFGGLFRCCRFYVIFKLIHFISTWWIRLRESLCIAPVERQFYAGKQASDQSDRTFNTLSFKHSGYVGASLVLELSRFFMIQSSWFSIFWFFWPNDSFFDMTLMELFVAYEPTNNIGALLKCFWDLDFWPDSPYIWPK